MKTIYRKVRSSEKLPDKTGWYNTSINKAWFFAGYWYRYEDPSESNLVNPVYWLEEIQLPTDEEMDAVAGEIAGVASLNNLHDEKPVLYGALRMKEWLLSKLKEQ
jgi:hypothetical protein